MAYFIIYTELILILTAPTNVVICICSSNGCATSEDMLWKLDALQSFIRELHWPEEVFAEHLDHRLKLMAADMIEAAAKRSVCLSVSLSVCLSVCTYK